jgi:mono/diheme cytochrome c family protein
MSSSRSSTFVSPSLGSLLAALVASIAIAGGSGCSEAEEPESTPTEDDLTQDGGIYHWSEGSDLLPYFALKALTATLDDGREVPFLSNENLKRFGFIPDSKRTGNPDGLPIGVALSRASDTGLVSLGFNCTACHTNEIVVPDANGARRTVRVDGSPSRVDFLRFFAEAFAALDDQIGKDASAWDRTKFALRAVAEARKIASRYEDFDGTPDSAWLRFKMFWTVARNARSPVSNVDIEAVVGQFDIPEKRKRLLIARYYQLRATLEKGDRDPGTPAGPGRVDVYAGGTNALFGGFGHYLPPKAPLRFQPLFNMGGKKFYSYTANTNSIMMRNTIQAMAVGGVIDVVGPNATGANSANFANIVKLEKAIYAWPVPKWPLPLNEQLVARGRQIYDATCASCHEPKTLPKGMYSVAVTPASKVGTDVNVIREYLAPITTATGQGILADVGSKLLRNAIEGYCAEASLSKGQCLQLDETYDARLNPEGRRDTPSLERTATGFEAKPLDGVWSYAPYLHNGSVPTLADLLEPSARRPKKFVTGHRTLDPKRVGYVLFTSLSDAAKREGGSFLLDTDLPGNSNAGHEGPEYGTDLSADDKLALLEYLKDFRHAR